MLISHWFHECFEIHLHGRRYHHVPYSVLIVICITDASCLALASLLRSGALPALEEVSLHQPNAEENDPEPFSPAHREIFAARERLHPIEFQSRLLSGDEEELGGL